MSNAPALTSVRLAVHEAVNTVNTHAGETCVRVRFANDPHEIDFIANAARLIDGAFEFQAGFETLAGKLDEIESIRTEPICH